MEEIKKLFTPEELKIISSVLFNDHTFYTDQLFLTRQLKNVAEDDDDLKEYEKDENYLKKRYDAIFKFLNFLSQKNGF